MSHLRVWRSGGRVYFAGQISADKSEGEFPVGDHGAATMDDGLKSLGYLLKEAHKDDREPRDT